MKSFPLYAMAHARSGDKGDASNVGVLAYDDRAYAILRERLTAAAVKEHFGDLVAGDVERYEMPNLRALNFILHDSLGGGGSASLKTDAQGKTHAWPLRLRSSPRRLRAAEELMAPEGESVPFVRMDTPAEGCAPSCSTSRRSTRWGASWWTTSWRPAPRWRRTQKPAA